MPGGRPSELIRVVLLPGESLENALFEHGEFRPVTSVTVRGPAIQRRDARVIAHAHQRRKDAPAEVLFLQVRVAPSHRSTATAIPGRDFHHLSRGGRTKDHPVFAQWQLHRLILLIVARQKGQFPVQRGSVQVALLLRGLLSVHFPLLTFGREHHGDFRVCHAEILDAFPGGANLRHGGGAIGKNARKLDILGFEAGRGRIEKGQAFVAGEPSQCRVISALVNHILHVIGKRGLKAERLSHARHPAGRPQTLAHGLQVLGVRNHAVFSAPVAIKRGEFQTHQVFTGVERDGRIREAGQVAVFLVVLNCHHQALFQGTGT